ncbi:MAG: response regulator [Patescibacteria group bacterium]|jgi:two-component system response regulator VicR
MITQKKKILIIDDEIDILTMYKDALIKSGFEVEITQSGEQGVELIPKFQPDAILLDILLPHTNGLDILDQIKKDSNGNKIPIYCLTNLPEESAKEKAMKMGAKEYYVKAYNEPDKIAQILAKELGGTNA